MCSSDLIAAIFPAGLSQQQRADDDIIGPIVAHNAMTILRSRLKQEDFGTCEEFDEDSPPRKWSPYLCGYPLNTNNDDYNNWPTICGDWMWRRPAIFQSDYSDPLLAGSIDIFGELGVNGLIAEDWYSDQTPNIPPDPMPGIPYNLSRFQIGRAHV